MMLKHEVVIEKILNLEEGDSNGIWGSSSSYLCACNRYIC